MAETPDEILRALADPQRLAIAGMLAGGDAPPTSWRPPRASRSRGPTST